MAGNTSAPKYAAPDPIDIPDRTWPSRTVDHSPIWCSVDLRDGNQALPNPMNPERKMEVFDLLCGIGFRDIETGFPSASQDDFDFTRRLIEDGHIPDDVFIMGLTQCREHLIDRTFEAFAGVPRAICHAYIATSELHMKQVFQLDRARTLDRAVEAVGQIRARADALSESDIRLQFSPEEFTDTDLDFAVEICEAVFEAWGRATPDAPLILNLPATVERRPPNHYADMIELFCRRFSHREAVTISIHSHNDQGMAVAASELAILAGAQRVEGTLFGHGERTGNVDLVTLANNLYARGVETGLDFGDLPRIVEVIERCTGMPVPPRQPYAGELVFTAFSGSHQDAIRKGMQERDSAPERFGVGWKVPYLHVDPEDLGRRFERLIRINSQSGKGGAAWVLETEYGIAPPKQMLPALGTEVQKLSDRLGREVTSKEVYDLFQERFVRPNGPYEVIRYWPRPDDEDPTLIHGELRLRVNGEEQTVSADGIGPVSAFVHAIQDLGFSGFKVHDFDEQAVGHGADATAYAYVPLELEDGKIEWGVGTDTNIDQAAILAIVAALNRAAGA
ncbi:MAG: 2-isopropylmalate synthase [Planctomycetota bacterium]